jgi:hypothetical protein
VEPATHVWTEWDPDTAPAPSGFFPFATVVPQLIERTDIDPAHIATFVEQVEEAGRRGRFFMSLTMYAVAARKP